MDEDEVERRLEAAVERLASIEHERWAHWQRYLHSKGEQRSDGSIVIPAALVAQWSRQMETRYEDLSPEERRAIANRSADIFRQSWRSSRSREDREAER